MSQTSAHPSPPQATRHSLLDDAQGIGYGAVMAALGVTILSHLGLITGQTAGLALLISYATGYSFGMIFFLVNIPFYWFGYSQRGAAFVVKTFVAVALVSVLSAVLPRYFGLASINLWVGATMFGLVSGSALLALFRHGASLGGIGILAITLQDRTGFRAGYTQLLFDACLFIIALFVRDVTTVAASALGALCVNLVITFNHRRDRYIAT